MKVAWWLPPLAAFITALATEVDYEVAAAATSAATVTDTAAAAAISSPDR